jgi:ComF family protein
MSLLARLRELPRSCIRAVCRVVLPPTCCLCGFTGAREGLDLCEICIGLLPGNGAQPGNYPPIFSRAVVPFEYAYPVDRFVRSLKFRGERVYARVLGTLLADAHRQSGGTLPRLLIPVPLHPLRYRTRGFNQAAEIAYFAGAQLGVRVDLKCLARVVATQEQSGLPLPERRRNVRGAFRVVRLPEVQHVALVDDVLTTGNTAAEAAGALAGAGIERVELWAIARVPASK